MTTVLKTVAATLLILIGGALAYAYSGFYDVSVGSGHNALTGWYLETVRDRAIQRRANDLTVPGDLDSSERIAAGAGHYGDMCAGCHGKPGRGPTERFDPAPPALSRGAPDPAGAFMAIRDGIKMSGMPRHDGHDDEAIWDIAAFLQVLPDMDEAEYEAMVAEAEHDHGDDGHSDGGEESADAHDHAAPETPTAALDAFHHALTEGDGEAALALLHENATILEGGHLETRPEYAEGHLESDMAFMAGKEREQLSREADVDDRQARVRTRTRLSDPEDSEAEAVVTEENATLVQTDNGWRITHLHWRAVDPTDE